MSSAATVTQTVRMDDGRDVDFAGKRKLLKSHTIDAETGEVTIRLDFVNGETRSFLITPELVAKCAAHGAEQKFGDEIAGVESVEDCVYAIDALIDRLDKGEWNMKRESSGVAGMSVLAKALIQMTGKTAEQIKEFLSGKTHAEKVALRGHAKVAVIIAELEALKPKKSGPVVDTDSMLNGLGA